MPREEPHEGAEAKLAEDKKGNTGEEGGEGKRDERGGNDRLGIVFSNDFGDFACENVEEWLPAKQRVEGHFLARTEEITTYHYFYHHAAVSTCETATAERVHELGDDCPRVGRSGSEKSAREGGRIHT